LESGSFQYNTTNESAKMVEIGQVQAEKSSFQAKFSYIFGFCRACQLGFFPAVAAGFSFPAPQECFTIVEE